jgi:thiol-disulfide isomerase/thioredoxin
VTALLAVALGAAGVGAAAGTAAFAATPAAPPGPATASAAAPALAPAATDAAPTSPGGAAVLALADLDGAPRSLEDLRGRIVVLNFWATWCIPCRAEMPLLDRVARRYAGRGVQVIGASADAPDRRREVERFARRLRLGFPIWIGATTADMVRLGLGEALPATAILDRDGRVAFAVLGPIEPGDLEARLDWLAGDRAAAPPAAHLDRFAAPTADRDEPGGPASPEGHDHPAEGPGPDHKGHGHAHGEKEDHAHGGVGIEGASLVPS